jgi:uncharacterized protein (UPF0276 family)
VTTSALPTLGAGLAYQPSLLPSLLQHRDSIDLIEYGTEYFMNARPEELSAAESIRLPYVYHGVDLSTGTAGPLEQNYVEAFAALVARSAPAWCSDHLSVSRVGASTLRGLSPVRFSTELAERVAANIVSLQKRLGTVFLIENIAPYFSIPGSEMREGEFFREVIERSGCGMLLDLANLVSAEINVGIDIPQYFRDIPLESVVEIHIAGGARVDDRYVDTHGSPVPDPVWELLRRVADGTDVKAVVLERDRNFPVFDELLDDLAKARRIIGWAH